MTATRKDYLANYTVAGVDDCWIFGGTLTPTGYGKVLKTTAQRYFYAALVGPIPEGHEIDHLCEVRACVNPDHLEPVLPVENNRRQRQTIGACSCCRRPATSVSQTLRQRGNPAVKCDSCANRPVYRGFEDLIAPLLSRMRERLEESQVTP